MKRRQNLKSRLTIITLSILMASINAFATDGYFGVGYGTKSNGMAGAGIALFQNSLFGANNPAGLVFLGDKYGLSLALFNPNRSYTVTGNPSGYPGTFGLTPGEVKSESNTFLMPAVSANWMLNEESAFNISLFGNGGMNTDYPTATFYGSNPTGVNLMQMFGAFTYSRKLGDQWSIGITAMTAWQSFEVKGLEAFSNFSSDPAKLTNNGASSAFGFGGKIGIYGQIAEGFSFGATYQSKISMGQFDDYAGLFAEEGDFDVPATWTAGIAYEFVPNKLVLALDIKQIFYSKVKSIANTMMNANGPNFPMGTETGAGFGWQDMTILKAGLEFNATKDWTLRTGYSTGKNPVQESEVMFNILAPGVIDDHITFGFSKKMGNQELNFAIVRALSNTVTGPNPMEAPSQQTIGLTMSQWIFEIGFTF